MDFVLVDFKNFILASTDQHTFHKLTNLINIIKANKMIIFFNQITHRGDFVVYIQGGYPMEAVLQFKDLGSTSFP